MRFPVFVLAFAALAAFSAVPKPKVKFTTNLGTFTVELEPEAAPKTVANFLAYVRSGHYKGTTFHRVIAKFMIQGGGMTADGQEKPTKTPVPNEAKQSLEKGVRNIRGAIAMARTMEPHSATAQFFVNTVDNAFLDYPGQDGWGYCAFGHVIDGMATVDKIRDVKTLPGDRPVQPVTIESASVLGQ
jgi:cyclophilin family peptidyl-prolyl cis-trans isomerase